MLTALCVAGLTVLVRPPKTNHRSPVGDCYAVFGGKRSINFALVDCSADNSTYKVVLTVDSPGWSLDLGACPGGPYRALRERIGDTECLMLDLGEGECLNRVTSRLGQRSDLVKGRCDDRSESKVTKVVTGPRESCGPGETTTFYSQPATTICLVKL
ncbi:hypothetical protein G7043_07015 [Lentzea sp. NEAU-D13]|uniref:Uncharacterized protein n=1 Tax=Lentzea alba TaxID=2714351 RepID=A0A7C9VW80_9PSEU|nr:hypothetical protein [Lentzea alba]NGY58680.1 hypothetical protein [Lentzea alba]